MRSKQPFLVAGGQLSDTATDVGSTALSAFWGGSLKKYSCLDSPNKVFNESTEKDGLTLLKGDAAQHYFEGPSWMETIGAWRIPIVLLVAPSSSGYTPGVVFAYAALCKELSVPLLGVVQLGGSWNVDKKECDNLPWCGWLPSNLQESRISGEVDNANYLMDTFVVAENIRKKYLYFVDSNLDLNT